MNKEEQEMKQYFDGHIAKVFAPEGSFMWAVEQPCGTKFTLKEYDIQGYLYFQDGYCYNEKDNIQTTIVDLAKSTWEIYEEPKKTLWDAKLRLNNDTLYAFSEKDVKEALQEFIGWIHKREPYEQNSGYTNNKAKEIFGEELLK